MKLLKKFSFALCVAVAVIVASVIYGQWLSTASLPDVTLNDWVCDSAGVLTPETEWVLSEYDRHWDATGASVVAVAAVDHTRGWNPEEFAVALGEKWGLGSRDAILVLDIRGEDCLLYLAPQFGDIDPSYFVSHYMEEDFFSGDYDAAVISLFAGLDDWRRETLGADGAVIRSEGHHAPAGNNSFIPGGFVMDIIEIILLIVILIAVFSWMDRIRYNSWYRRYGYMDVPPVRYVPILFWHRPGTRWWGRRPRGPGVPPPVGFGGPRPGPSVRPGPRPGSFGGGRSGGTSRSSGFGSIRSSARGGSFGSGRSGSFSGGSRRSSGGFGGIRSSARSGRSGSFGGGRGGRGR